MTAATPGAAPERPSPILEERSLFIRIFTGPHVVRVPAEFAILSRPPLPRKPAGRKEIEPELLIIPDTAVPGAWLGQPISKTIIEGHGGRINLCGNLAGFLSKQAPGP
jgi:hypothetical protein